MNDGGLRSWAFALTFALCACAVRRAAVDPESTEASPVPYQPFPPVQRSVHPICYSVAPHLSFYRDAHTPLVACPDDFFGTDQTQVPERDDHCWTLDPATWKRARLVGTKNYLLSVQHLGFKYEQLASPQRSRHEPVLTIDRVAIVAGERHNTLALTVLMPTGDEKPRTITIVESTDGVADDSVKFAFDPEERRVAVVWRKGRESTISLYAWPLGKLIKTGALKITKDVTAIDWLGRHLLLWSASKRPGEASTASALPWKSLEAMPTHVGEFASDNVYHLTKGLYLLEPGEGLALLNDDSLTREPLAISNGIGANPDMPNGTGVTVVLLRDTWLIARGLTMALVSKKTHAIVARSSLAECQWPR